MVGKMYPSNVWCFTREAIVSMRRRKLIAVATLSTCFIALLVLAATVIATLNLSLASKQLRDSAQVTVFLRKDAGTSERATFEAWLASRTHIRSYDYVSPQTALGELADRLGNDSRLLEAAGGNPIPPSFRIHAARPEQVRPLVSALKARREVSRVVFASDATSRLVSMSRVLNVAGILLSFLLGLAAITIIHNAMAVAIDSRRRDIRIMRLVGADPMLIRLPYLITGALYGIAAAVLASLVTVTLYSLIAGAVAEAFPFIPTATVGQAATLTVPVTILLGATFGVLGAAMSLGRHLQPHISPCQTGVRDLRLGVPTKVALSILALVIVLMSAVAVRADAGLVDKIGRANDLGTSIAAGTRRLKVLGARITSSETRLAGLTREMGRLKSHIVRVDADKSRISSRLSAQLLAFYAAGRGDQIENLAGSRSIEEALVTSQRLSFILELEAEGFDRARKTLDDLYASRAQLGRAQREASSILNNLRRLRQQLKERAASRKVALRRLTDEIRGSVAVYGTTAVARDVAVYGTDGFIFPVAAPHRFSNDWHQPRSGGRKHKGTDVMASMGAPLLSVVGGTVRFGSNELGGTTIHLDGADGADYYYAHLSGYAQGVTSGATVAPGRLIGYVGDSGNAKGTSPHLHFEIHPDGGAAVNPYPTLTQSDELLFQ